MRSIGIRARKPVSQQMGSGRFRLTPINSKELSFIGIDAFQNSLVFAENIGRLGGAHCS